MVMAAVLLASKFLDEARESSQVLAVLAGVGLEVLVDLEREFLQRVRFRLFVAREEY
jgi:hypothetical protein